VGGGYHEAWHTKYSCRRNLTVDEACALILPRWAKLPDWAPLQGLLQEWNNIVEDIRIERRGNEDYPGCPDKMCELQDFILMQEFADRQELLTERGPKPLEKPLPIVTGMFRDMGLGYDTDTQNQALRSYRERNADACDLVENGPLRPLLNESIDMPRTDVLGCLRVAMDVLIELQKLIDPEDMKKAAEDAQASGGKPKCPKCGAPGKDLVVRPLSDGKGGKIKGKGIITCTKCGWQEVVDLKTAPPSATQPVPPQDADDMINFEDMPQQSGDADSDSDGEGPPGDGKGSGKGKGGDENKADGKGQGSSSGEGDAEGDEEASGGSGGDEGEGDEGEGDEGEGSVSGDGDNDDASENGGKDGKSQGKGKGQGDDSTDSEGKEPAPGAGGHHWDPERAKAWELVAEQVLDAASKGEEAGLRDLSSALEEAIEAVRERESKDCTNEEKVWRPYNPALDIITLVPPSDEGKAADQRRAKALLASVKAECSFLRARLRAIVRAVEQRSVVHGVRRGRELSERMLVDSVAAIRSGQAPSRAYYTVSDKVDTSIAAAIVIDQSSSMSWPKSKLQDATRCLVALTEPLDSIGAAVLVAGFRDGPGNPNGVDFNDMQSGDFHRAEGVCHDVFKGFDEKFQSSCWRFANTRAVGGTPMADGVQFGLECLSNRPEAHRVLFIVTDGEPNYGHTPVIKRQIRLAKKSGINVIGVGIGADSKSVMTLFPDHVWAANISELPKALIDKLNEILDFRGIGRGRPLAKSA
jgi:cobalamin biosynthesis protein CobT